MTALVSGKMICRSIDCLPEKHNCHPRIHERRCISNQTEVRLILLSKGDLFSNTADRYWTALLRKSNYPEAQRGS